MGNQIPTVMPALVAGIHALTFFFENAKTWMAGTRGEAMPFFERLCPAMTSQN